MRGKDDEARGLPLTMGLLLVCIAVQELVSQIAPSAWWVPDLTVVGLVVAVVRSPAQWFACAALAGLSTTVWAIRFAQPIFMTTLLLGGALALVSKRFDTTDRRMHYLLVGLCSVIVTMEPLWLEGLWSPGVLGLAGVRVTLTLLALPLVRRLLLETRSGFRGGGSGRLPRTQPAPAIQMSGGPGSPEPPPAPPHVWLRPTKPRGRAGRTS